LNRGGWESDALALSNAKIIIKRLLAKSKTNGGQSGALLGALDGVEAGERGVSAANLWCSGAPASWSTGKPRRPVIPCQSTVSGIVLGYCTISRWDGCPASFSWTRVRSSLECYRNSTRRRKEWAEKRVMHGQTNRPQGRQRSGDRDLEIDSIRTIDDSLTPQI
jgi:hypothetical protein